MASVTVRELGIPVRSVNWVRVFAGQRRNGEPLILVCMGQQAGSFFVCDVDPESGHCCQAGAGLSDANYPTAACFNPETGVLYLGSAYTGHLHRYDPNAPVSERRLEDLGAIDPDFCRFPCAIDESLAGEIYIGAHPGCCLTKYDPQTDTFTRFGRMDETDMYFYPACGADGTVAGLVKMSSPHVVALDARTGEKRPVGPRQELESSGPPIALKKGVDGLLYLNSPEGVLQISGTKASPVREAPAEMPPSKLPDGTAVELLDGHRNGYRVLKLSHPTGEEKILHLDWQGDGSSIFLVHDGPDGQIYGSSILPEYLFSHNPSSGCTVDLGICSESIGEAYSMANFQDKLFIASYPHSRLSVYDSAKPYNYGTAEESNPRDLGRLDDVSTRPRALLAGPAGKVWMGSFPDYGRWGGTLAWYDPNSGQSRSHRHIVPDCSVVALEWIPELDRILVGTSINGGTGTKPKAALAPFVLWDPHRDCATETIDFGMLLNDGVLDLKYSGNGQAYAVIALAKVDPRTGAREVYTELVLLDVVNRLVLDRSPFENPNWPLEMSLRPSPEGTFYGCQSATFYRVRPGTAQRETLWEIPYENSAEHIHAAGAFVAGSYYFGTNHRLRAFNLNPETT